MVPPVQPPFESSTTLLQVGWLVGDAHEVVPRWHAPTP
jgi:hypothetical protein